MEIGEIDNFISQHPLVRENVSLIRRDKDEVNYCFSSISTVAELTFWGRNPRSYHISYQI